VLQLVLGVFIPLAMLYADEEVARRRFEITEGCGTGFTHGFAFSTVLQILLVPLQTFIAFHVLLLTMEFGVLDLVGKFIHWRYG
jgi:hypothetical protein